MLDGECKSVRRFEAKDGLWKHWCYANPEEDCGDIQDGWSFKACTEGTVVYISLFRFIFIKDVQTATLFIMLVKKLVTAFSRTTVMIYTPVTGLFPEKQTILK